MSGVLGRHLVRAGLGIVMVFVRVFPVCVFLRSLAQRTRNIGNGFYGLGCRCWRFGDVG
jgi:hypothetical protein